MGRTTPDDVVGCVRPQTALASVGLANGEVGVVAPVAAIASALRPRGVLLHTDAAQAAGRMPVDVGTLGVDLLSLSSHKLGGPAGVGALWVRPGAPATARHGWAAGAGRRAGTENVGGHRRLRAAAAAVVAELPRGPPGKRRCATVSGTACAPACPTSCATARWTGRASRIRSTSAFPACAGESLLVLLDLGGVAVSLGSACAAGSAEPSHVLLAMGLDAERARSGLRLSVGPDTTAGEIDAVIDLLPRRWRRSRQVAA